VTGPSTGDGPVTLVLTRHARPGAEAAFDDLLHRLAAAAIGFPGHLGVQVLRPEPGSGAPYTIVVRFASQAELDTWTGSEVRRALLAEAERLTVDGLLVHRLSGMEGWVRLPGANVVVPPPRWKVAAVTWVAILPVIEVLSALLIPSLTAWPWYARPVALTLVMIPLMTWVVMPAATRLARPFLYPSR
jgi:antibiotic biosynthesis monooxygenase (ABM) superfamily enzyme